MVSVVWVLVSYGSSGQSFGLLDQFSIIVMQFLCNQIDLKGLELVGKHYFSLFCPFI